MKIFLLTSLIIALFFNQCYSQTDDHPYPKSVADIGLGIGPNYGVNGLKAVLGYKGSGLLLGLGGLKDRFAYEIGLQGSVKWWFINIGYGVYGTYLNNTTGKNELVKGMIMCTGFKINLLKNKRLFLELGAGYADYGYIISYQNEKIPVSGGRFSAGLGYRIGGYK